MRAMWARMNAGRAHRRKKKSSLRTIHVTRYADGGGDQYAAPVPPPCTCTSVVVSKPDQDPRSNDYYSKVYSTGPSGEPYSCNVGLDKAVVCEKVLQHDFCNCALDSRTGTVAMWMSEVNLERRAL